MKIVAYLLSFVLTFSVGALIAGLITFIPTILHAYIYKKANGFWESFISGGVECFILTVLSMWVFSWFNFHLPLLYVIIITIAFLSNNYYRLQTRSNYNSELGYLVSQSIGFFCVYASLIQNEVIPFNFL